MGPNFVLPATVVMYRFLELTLQLPLNDLFLEHQYLICEFRKEHLKIMGGEHKDKILLFVNNHASSTSSFFSTAENVSSQLSLRYLITKIWQESVVFQVVKRIFLKGKDLDTLFSLCASHY